MTCSMTRPENILQLYARAPAPCRDYFGLTVNTESVVLNIWNISHGPHVYPKRIKVPLDEFSLAKSLHTEITRLFGEHVFIYIWKLSKSELNLQYLPSKIFHYILKKLAANDILKLSQTSKIFFQLCNTNPVWEIIYRKRLKSSPSVEDLKKSTTKSWQDILKSKYFKKGSSVIKSIANKSVSSKKEEKPKMNPKTEVVHRNSLKKETATKTLPLKQPLRQTTQKLEQASRVAQGILKNCNVDLEELNKMQIKHHEIFGSASKSKTKTNSKKVDLKIQALRNIGVMPEHPRYLEARAKAQTIIDVSTNSIQSFPKTVHNAEKKTSKHDTKLESSTHVDLLGSFRGSTTNVRQKFGQAKSAVNVLPPKSNVGSTSQLQGKAKYKSAKPYKAGDILKYIEGVNSNVLSMERLQQLKDVEAKVKFGGVAKPIRPTTNKTQGKEKYEKLTGEHSFPKKLTAKPMSMFKA